jgi:hypothetical protein
MSVFTSPARSLAYLFVAILIFLIGVASVFSHLGINLQ